MIEKLVRCLSIDAGTEGHRFADQCVVHRDDARPEISAVSESANIGRTQKASALVTVQGLQTPTTIEQRPCRIIQSHDQPPLCMIPTVSVAPGATHGPKEIHERDQGPSHIWRAAHSSVGGTEVPLV